MPMPLQGAVAHLGHRRGDFPQAERAAAEVLSIPVHSELDGEDVARVIEAARGAVREVEA